MHHKLLQKAFDCKAVEFPCEELTVATRHPVHDEPPDVEHGGVMVDVQEGDLVVVLPQNEEESVHKLNEFGEVIPPKYVYHLRRD